MTTDKRNQGMIIGVYVQKVPDKKGHRRSLREEGGAGVMHIQHSCMKFSRNIK